jgi:hypothetical protein
MLRGTLVSLDLDIVLRREERVEALCRKVFTVERFSHSINLQSLNRICGFRFKPILVTSVFPSMHPKNVLGVDSVARAEGRASGKGLGCV